MRTYVKRYAAAPARRVALFTNNEDGWRTVETALRRGTADRGRRSMRGRTSRLPIARSRPRRGFPVLHGSVIGVDGGKDGVRKIAVSLGGSARAEVEADGLAVSGGWNPAVGLTSYHRGRPKWRDDIAAFVPDGAPPGMVAAGAANGDFRARRLPARRLRGRRRSGRAMRGATAMQAGHRPPTTRRFR